MYLDQTIVLSVQLYDGNTTKYIKAIVKDNTGTEISSSPFYLNHIGNGLYTNTTLTMPNVDFITATYEVYNDSSYTNLSSIYGRASDVFMLDTSISNIDSLLRSIGSNLTGSILDDTPPVPKRSITILRNEDRLITVRIINSDTEEPYDLTNYTKITTEFKKSDNTKLRKATHYVATKASTTYNSITFTAVNYGIIGNNITITFDGIFSITQLINNWNALNPDNTVTSDASDPSIILPAGTITLSGGVDASPEGVSVISEILGKISITLSETDTSLLKLGKEMTFDIIIEKGTDRRIVRMANCLNIQDGF